MLGINLDPWSPAELLKDSDRLIVVAYPSFNPKVRCQQYQWDHPFQKSLTHAFLPIRHADIGH